MARRAAERLTAQGLGNRIAPAGPAAGRSAFGLLGYYSWGSNAEGNRRRAPDVTFYPGALAGMFVSTDGRTFKEPPASWQPGDSAPDARFAGTSDSLAADLIRAGVTGVSANVDEPYLDASIRPDILFPAYAGGRNLAESFYAAMPYLSWQTLIVGDPLCAPFPRQPLTAEATDPPIEATTELPAEFSRRKLANIYPAISRSAVSRTTTHWARTGASRWCRTRSTRWRGCSTCWVATWKRRAQFETRWPPTAASRPISGGMRRSSTPPSTICIRRRPN